MPTKQTAHAFSFEFKSRAATAGFFVTLIFLRARELANDNFFEGEFQLSLWLWAVGEVHFNYN